MHGGVTGKAREGLPMSIGIGFALVKQLVGVDIGFTRLATPIGFCQRCVDGGFLATLLTAQHSLGNWRRDTL